MQVAELEDRVKVLEEKVKDLTKRLKEVESPELTPEEIRDVEESLKEIRGGRSKKFDGVEEGLKWLKSEE